MQQFVSSPLLREKRFARENQELRNKIDDLEDTNSETEMRYKAVVAEINTMETKLKLAKSRNDDLQKQLQYKSTALENSESALNDLKKRHEYQASDVRRPEAPYIREVIFQMLNIPSCEAIPSWDNIIEKLTTAFKLTFRHNGLKKQNATMRPF
ncbi:unnamed protein product, partial [Mesorhabditis belari]|uniref:Uncharacterized protein n=1 Tax=Mesorhabditis belari TaxID=2138241 RepID=A0AAF3J8N4_9BILA